MCRGGGRCSSVGLKQSYSTVLVPHHPPLQNKILMGKYKRERKGEKKKKKIPSQRMLHGKVRVWRSFGCCYFFL